MNDILYLFSVIIVGAGVSIACCINLGFPPPDVRMLHRPGLCLVTFSLRRFSLHHGRSIVRLPAEVKIRGSKDAISLVIAGTCRCLLEAAGPSIMRDCAVNNPTVSIDTLEPISAINSTGREKR